jgi:hypothetical protein
MTERLRLLFGLRSGALPLRLMRPTRVDRGHMNFLAELARDYAALLISICALFLTISQTRATHKHNRLTVRPHIATYTDSKAGLEHAGVRLVEVKITNSGLGPAIIKSFEPLLDGVPLKADEPDDLFPVVAKTIPAALISDECYITVLRPGHVMAKDEVVTIAHLAMVPTIHDDSEALKNALNRFHIRVRYESGYEEPFVYDSRDHRKAS